MFIILHAPLLHIMNFDGNTRIAGASVLYRDLVKNIWSSAMYIFVNIVVFSYHRTFYEFDEATTN